MLYLTELDNYSSKVPDNLANTVTDDSSNFSLEGLQYATNLKKLTLTNQLNYEPMAFRGDLVDVSLLKTLTKLEYVDLSNNQIEDITPITSLPNVTYLNVQYNSIKDLSSIVKSRYTDDVIYNYQLAAWNDPVYISPGSKIDDYWPVTIERKELFPSDTDPRDITTEIATGAMNLVHFRYYTKGAYAGTSHGFLNGNDLSSAGAPVINSDGSMTYHVIALNGKTTEENETQIIPAGTQNYIALFSPYAFYLPKFIFENGSPIFLSFTPYMIQEDLATLNAHDSEIYVGDSWEAEENFDASLDHEGNPLDFGKVTVSGSVDTNTAGDYPITYSYGSLTKTITVTVKANQAQINAKDTTIYVGDSWKPADTFISATDRDGADVSVDQLEVTHAVDTSNPGDRKSVV